MQSFALGHHISDMLRCNMKWSGLGIYMHAHCLGHIANNIVRNATDFLLSQRKERTLGQILGYLAREDWAILVRQ